jgi:hypothetical protein
MKNSPKYERSFSIPILLEQSYSSPCPVLPGTNGISWKGSTVVATTRNTTTLSEFLFLPPVCVSFHYLWFPASLQLSSCQKLSIPYFSFTNIEVVLTQGVLSIWNIEDNLFPSRYEGHVILGWTTQRLIRSKHIELSVHGTEPSLWYYHTSKHTIIKGKKVKLSMCYYFLSVHQATKVYWGSGCIAPRIFHLGTRWRQVVSFTPRLLYLQGKSPWYPLDRRLGGPPSRYGPGGEKNSQPLTEIEPPDHPARSPVLFMILMVKHYT